MLRLDPRERERLQPGNVGVVMVNDSRDPTQVFDRITTRVQQPPKLLLEGMPILLALAQASREVEQDD